MVRRVSWVGGGYDLPHSVAVRLCELGRSSGVVGWCGGDGALGCCLRLVCRAARAVELGGWNARSSLRRGLGVRLVKVTAAFGW